MLIDEDRLCVFNLRMKLSLDLARRAGIAAVIVGLALLHLSGTARSQIEPNSPPSITLTNPASGSVFEFVATIRLKAAATDVDGSIVEVRFYEGTNLLGTVTQSPFNLIVTVQEMLQNNFCYYATATDDRGASATSEPVRLYITQGAIPPSVALTQPGEGEAFLQQAAMTMTAVVRAYDGTENPVQFFSGTNLIESAETPLHTVSVTNSPPWLGPYTATYYSVTVSNLPIGGHILTARYVDSHGNDGTSQEVRIRLTPLVLLDPKMSPDGSFHCTVKGLSSGKDFQIEASSNLSSWFSVATNTAASNTFHFVDASVTNAQRFYRAFVTSP